MDSDKYRAALRNPNSTWEDFMAIDGICPECGQIPLGAVPSEYYISMAHFYEHGKLTNKLPRRDNEVEYRTCVYKTTGQKRVNKETGQTQVYLLNITEGPGNWRWTDTDQIVAVYGPNITNAVQNCLDGVEKHCPLIG